MHLPGFSLDAAAFRLPGMPPEGAPVTLPRRGRRPSGFLLLAPLLAPLAFPGVARAQDYDPDHLATFSILARDPATGELGVGVQSKAFGAGNRAMHAVGGVAVIAHQASANPRYGPLGIELLQQDYTPEEALELLVATDQGRDRRQVSILDIQGRTAAWTGEGTNDWKGHLCGEDFCAQGNILTGPEVVEAMARSFQASRGPLAERLMDALDAAQAAGGDARGMQSGAILVVRPMGDDDLSDRVVDIRVDDHREPLRELRRVLDVYRSGQMITQANALLAAGDTQGALRTALLARDTSPGNDNAWVALAHIHLRMGARAEALAALGEAVSLNPWNRTQLPRNANFESLRTDPAFLRITGG
jgi:uncharacterized Ntn-hydrolase superfamily protein